MDVVERRDVQRDGQVAERAVTGSSTSRFRLGVRERLVLEGWLQWLSTRESSVPAFIR
jgi:hypothetical protein